MSEQAPDTTATEDLTCDVVVVGAGAAGLSATVALVRSLRSVVVIDGGDPRNAVSAHAHNVLGREGVRPLDLLAEGRREAKGYGARFFDGRAVAARRDGEDLEVELLCGAVVRARRMLLATGLTDELPDVPGLRDFWGTSVLHCPYCHGWEVRGRRLGVLATSPMSLHQALLFRQLSQDVTLFVQDLEIPTETAAQFSALGIMMLPGTVRRVSGNDGDLRVDVDGIEIGVQALVVAPRFHARADLFVQLGGQVTSHPNGSFVRSGATGTTDVPGVWAAGNVTDLSAWVAASTGSGVLAGAAINVDLAVADARTALHAKPRAHRRAREVDHAAPRPGRSR